MDCGGWVDMNDVVILQTVQAMQPVIEELQQIVTRKMTRVDVSR